MDFTGFARSRKSARGFLDKAVPQQVVDEIIDAAAWERGLGCVINGQGIMQSDVVREHAQIPDDENIMICIALGYPDDSFPANHVRSERADNSEFVRYMGF